MKNFFASRHKRVFDKFNPFWNDQDRVQNAIYVSYIQSRLNDVLQVRGYVSLNEALEFLGFERTVRGGQAGWIRDVDPEEGDGHIDFGVWAEGYARGKDWLHGNLDSMTLYFNVDRVEISMPRRVKKLKAEGKLP